ncbi:hypothetical protein [Dolichospermum circinale]|uniref:hypothetical protein n=1 Tax=Dolichospermum circinale TaxID=109265 RepID=UPI0004135BBF|nr:hypothetical protein [Dolichospermum circinale]MDB9482400.1 DUF975 domain-containing protein [Dolichospermum circinale CS-537/05]MDB9452895.1 DUF975 domain-containing protein [Dolichospermum circinale CS-541/06]MDB9461285.1 DUF975 domain-containing protein [Dolichospermum circinale CS-541/04]MDB9474452.1 DUF975 domain-containing protein [Dolichospermum circinale CS-537/11]MDB9478433.1 DUF975 domain-containing protein [Dolichospermum circinale CS-537/03]
MSKNFNSPNLIQPLNIANVISAGMRLYRSHLKKYFLIALKACVWLLVPIYGWVKFYALSALISRLSFGELVNQPESVSEGERFVNSRLWEFFVNMIFMVAIGLCIGSVFTLIGGLLISTSALLGSQDGNVANRIIYGLIVLVFAIIACTGILWIAIRFYLVDVSLAVENDVNGSSTINRSWKLTKGNVGRILLISLIGFLITIPIQFIVKIITTIITTIIGIIGLIVTPFLRESDPIFSKIFFVISLLLILGITFVSGALILPFVQTVKAVVYYDLRSQHEGIGLQLRNHDI